MKGTIINFKDKVYQKIDDVYKSYKWDFQATIGKLINEKNNSKDKKYSHKIIEENER